MARASEKCRRNLGLVDRNFANVSFDLRPVSVSPSWKAPIVSTTAQSIARMAKPNRHSLISFFSSREIQSSSVWSCHSIFPMRCNGVRRAAEACRPVCSVAPEASARTAETLLCHRILRGNGVHLSATVFHDYIEPKILPDKPITYIPPGLSYLAVVRETELVEI